MKEHSPSNHGTYLSLKVVYSAKQASCEWLWARGFCVRKSIFFAMMMARGVDNKSVIIFEAWGRLMWDWVGERAHSGVLLSVITRVGFCVLNFDSRSFKL